MAKIATKKPVQKQSPVRKKRQMLNGRVTREDVHYAKDIPIPPSAIPGSKVGRKVIYDFPNMEVRECLTAPASRHRGVLAALRDYMKKPVGKNKDFVYELTSKHIRVWRVK